MSTAQFANMSAADADAFMAVSHVQPVRKRLAEIVGNGTIIDIGCGKGDEVSSWFDPVTYFGVDCSRELILFARERNPGYRFSTLGALDIVGHWNYAIIKAVLEHLPPYEAQAVYDHARTLCDTLLVAWHTEPGRESLAWYDGELGRMQQNRHSRNMFGGSITREVCGKHVIWQVV